MNNASIAGGAPAPGSAVYSAAKHYEGALSETPVEELADEGITVTVLCPGETDTGFFDRGDDDESGAADVDMMTPVEVGDAGYEGLMAGERVVVPGGLNKLRVFLGRLLPRSLYAKSTGRSLAT